MNTKLVTIFTLLVMAAVIGIGLLIDWPADTSTTSVIVQGNDFEAAAEAVRSVGGEITHELGVIRSVGATVTGPQLTRLKDLPDLRVHENRSVEVCGKPSKEEPFGVVARAVVAERDRPRVP